MFFGLWKDDDGISEDDPRFVPLRDFIMSPDSMPAADFLQRLQAMLLEEDNPLAEYDSAIVQYTIKYLIDIVSQEASLRPLQRAIVWNALTEVVYQGMDSQSKSRDVMAIATFINTCR